MEVEYWWLVDSFRVRNELVHTHDSSILPSKLVGWPHLFRYGTAELTGTKPLGITMAEKAEAVERSRFYLSAVGPDASPLDLDYAFFLPSLGSPVIPVGPKFLEVVEQHCSVDQGYVIPIDSDLVQSHRWDYFVPRDDSGLRQLLDRMHLEFEMEDEIPGNPEMMRILCHRYPSPPMPPMRAIFPPSIPSAHVQSEWEADQLVLWLRDDPVVNTRHGKVAVDDVFWEQCPIVRYYGYLLPGPLGECVYRQAAADAGLTCVVKVVIRG